MPNTASASVFPWTCAMPQSSRTMVTLRAFCSQRAISGAAGLSNPSTQEDASSKMTRRLGIGQSSQFKGLENSFFRLPRESDCAINKYVLTYRLRLPLVPFLRSPDACRHRACRERIDLSSRLVSDLAGDLGRVHFVGRLGCRAGALRAKRKRTHGPADRELSQRRDRPGARYGSGHRALIHHVSQSAPERHLGGARSLHGTIRSALWQRL